MLKAVTKPLLVEDLFTDLPPFHTQLQFHMYSVCGGHLRNMPSVWKNEQLCHVLHMSKTVEVLG